MKYINYIYKIMDFSTTVISVRCFHNLMALNLNKWDISRYGVFNFTILDYKRGIYKNTEKISG